jgi:hypothetical protein
MFIFLFEEIEERNREKEREKHLHSVLKIIFGIKNPIEREASLR